MFFSLNKKIFLTIFVFFLLSAGIFILILDDTIGKKIRAEHSGVISRNQYVIELLHENISLRKRIDELLPENTAQISDLLNEKQEELTRERKLNEELNQNYNDNYATLRESLTILSTGALLTLISLIIMWFLLRRWVIFPISEMTALSSAIAQGDFSKRLTPPKSQIKDEFNTLINTFNAMLDNIENNINEVKEKEIFLQNIIDAVPDAIRVIDEDHNIILSNAAYAEHIQKNYFFKATKCYKAYNAENDCPCSSTQYICPLKELQKRNSDSIKLIHSVNDRPLSINSARILLNGKYGIVESIRDLSSNVSYSHQQKISSLGFLTTSLAHEMKNNLGAISLILEGILQKYYNNQDKNETEKNYLIMIANQIRECIRVPERLLKISRNTEQTDTEFNIAAAISDVLSLLDYEIKSNGILLVKNFSNSKETLLGNETDFKMIILNLLQNAIKAMKNSGTLEIKTNRNKENIIISIKDNGCGIKEEALKHIFEPFYSTSSNEQTGTGLGLAIVKNLVLKFNGKISVSSKENSGSCFEIILPRQKMQKMLVK